jgi:hypothetical protein
MRTKALPIVAMVALAVVISHAQGGQNAQGGRGAQGGGRGAQGGRGGQGGPVGQNPASDILFRAQNALGVLRGLDQLDSVHRIEYWATGTMTIQGQASKLTDYRASLNYAFPGMRVDVKREGATPQRVIQVVSGRFAWNEAEPGMNATPMPAAVNERLIQLWSTPMGALKAAVAAGANVQLSTEGASNVLTFTLPAPLDNATMKLTLNRQEVTMATGEKRQVNNMVEKAEVRIGNTVSETMFSDYGDWNDKDSKADIMLPRRIVQKQGAATVLDLMITRTNTYNPYVIMPVPATVGKAAAQ